MPVVDRMCRILRKGVQKVSQHQFLMLLLVMQSDLDDRKDPFGLLRRFDQLDHRRIDMRAVGRGLGDAGARDQTALRAGVTRACRHIVGIE